MNLELNKRLHERYDKKLYYHGREQGKRPYTGTYIFITDNMGYAAGYSDGDKLYTYTVPFGEDRIFSIKNKKDLLVLQQYVNNETINAVLRDSGAGQEMDWAALSYISTDDYEMPEELFQHAGYLAIRLKERQGIDSLYVFDENDLDFKGEIDISTPENIKKIGQFYREFTKDKNFLQENLKEEIIKELTILTESVNIDETLNVENGLFKSLFGMIKDNGGKFRTKLQGEFLRKNGDRIILSRTYYGEPNPGTRMTYYFYLDDIGITKVLRNIDDGKSNSIRNYWKRGDPPRNSFTEGVADKYAEKQFNIPDSNKEMDRQATTAMGQAQQPSQSDPKGLFVGSTGASVSAPISYGSRDTNVYLNPKSLQDFEEDVKAVSNDVGDLFVAQTDADIYHSDIVNGVDSGDVYSGYIGNAYDGLDTITWHRIGKSDDFGFSISYLDFNKNPENHPRRDELMKRVKAKNPRYNFLPFYWREEYNRRYDQENNMNNSDLSSEPIYEQTNFIDLPQDLFDRLRMRKFSDDANRSHMKLFKAKDGNQYIISKEINRDVFRAQTLDGEQIAVAVFDDDKPEYFSGYETSQSIMVQPEYRRLGIASALTDFAETIYGKPYRPTKVLSEPMQQFVKNRFGAE